MDYRGEQTIALEGSDITFIYKYELGEPETRDHPGSGLHVELTAAMMLLPDRNGNMIIIDVLSILDIDVDHDWAVDVITDTLND